MWCWAVPSLPGGLTARGLPVPLMTQPHCRFPGAHLLYFSPHSQFSVLRSAAQGLFPVCLAPAAPGAAQCSSCSELLGYFWAKPHGWLSTCWPLASARTVVPELRGPQGPGSGLHSCAPGGALHSSHGTLLEAGHGWGDGHWACGLCRVLNWGLFWGLQSRQGRGGEAAGLWWAPRLQSQSSRLGTGTHSCPPTTTSIPAVGLFN